ncbi:O-acyltransferase like protein, partial [Biomphalaria glabrata]
LTPPYMLSFLFFLGLQSFMGFGALWATVQPADKPLCEESWWTNLLYVNNLNPVIQQCMPFTWYLAADMQFHIISPLMIIPFF